MIKRVQLVVRKTGHVVEYAILAVLCWRAGSAVSEQPPVWSWKRAGFTFGLTVAYAITDEVHQSFVSTRMGSAWDVLIDSVGAFIGLILVWTWRRWRDYS